MRKKSVFVVLFALLGFANYASAVPIDGGETFSVNWFVDLDDATTSSDLTATSTWSVSSYSATSIVLDVSIHNTTVLDAPALTEAAIVSFGFGVDPNATATLTTPGSVFDLVGTGSGGQQTFPGGFKQIDICLFADGCSGGDVKNGLQAGGSDSLQITLLGTFGTTTELLFFPAKWQTTVGSFEPAGSVGVFEPGSLGLVALGLFGVAAVRGCKKTI